MILQLIIRWIKLETFYWKFHCIL